jgi:hypothetical protein
LDRLTPIHFSRECPVRPKLETNPVVEVKVSQFTIATQKGSYAGLVLVFPIKTLSAAAPLAHPPGLGGGLISLTMLGQRGAYLASADLDLTQAQAVCAALEAAIEQARPPQAEGRPGS